MQKENLYMPDHIRTYTGKYIDPFNPESSDIDILDIAHALSHQCRFAGHTTVFYSVAQHCVMVSENQLVLDRRLQALLHDASEAYLLDIPSPVKSRIKKYAEAENQLMHRISARFGFWWPAEERLKQADREALEYEWDNLVIRFTGKIRVWGPDKAKEKFLETYHSLTK